MEMSPVEPRPSLLPQDAGTEPPPAAPVMVEEDPTRALPLKKPRTAAPPIPSKDGKLVVAVLSVAVMGMIFLTVLAVVGYLLWRRFLG